MYDIIIIGAGPAGMTAAVYALRAGKSVLVLERESIGGQIAASPKVENWPGAISISGAELADNMFSHMTELGADFQLENVVDIKQENDMLTVVTEDGEHIAKAIIIAAGSKHRHLGLEGEDDMSGISYCAVCDGAFYKGKTVAVVGGGSAALQDAIFLSAACKTVYVIHRRDDLRGETSLVETLRGRGNVRFVLSAVVTKLIGGDELKAIEVESVKTGATRQLEADGLFVAVGRSPENNIFKHFAKLDENGYLDSGEDCMTRTPGIFVAGDCRKKQVRQLTTAVSDGSTAALAACSYVDGK